MMRVDINFHHNPKNLDAQEHELHQLLNHQISLAYDMAIQMIRYSIATHRVSVALMCDMAT